MSLAEGKQHMKIYWASSKSVSFSKFECIVHNFAIIIAYLIIIKAYFSCL